MIVSINNNVYQKNVKQNGNQQNFTALKKINFFNEFDPKSSLESAKALLAFKKSEPLKRFFEKYDGIAEFITLNSAESILGDWLEPSASLTIKYNTKPVEKNTVKEINKGFFNKIKTWFRVNYKKENPTYDTFSICGLGKHSDWGCSGAIKDLKHEINKLTDADIERELRTNTAIRLENAQETERLNAVLKEIDKLS